MTDNSDNDQQGDDWLCPSACGDEARTGNSDNHQQGDDWFCPSACGDEARTGNSDNDQQGGVPGPGDTTTAG